MNYHAEQSKQKRPALAWEGPAGLLLIWERKGLHGHVYDGVAPGREAGCSADGSNFRRENRKIIGHAPIGILSVAGIDGFLPRNYCNGVKVRDIIKLIERDGWYCVRTKGSHRQYKHLTKSGLVTIPGNTGDDMAPGTLNNILKQAGLK